ncbi:TOMM precursor leader peptide-binding protein [Nocardiopsis halophila]|uniref:TOMM precursor leader peptide-binding protein n=1 Tax=Nocardiopsis halophila TaxID=141692 RepID=UPI000346E5F3|nr:TOMM precursor leader peptide-binding protein [Nocardiopsis halophila]
MTSTGTRSWLVNTEARVLAHGPDILIRRGGLVSRCTGAGIREFVAELLDKAVEGRVVLDAAEAGEARTARFEALMARLVAGGLFIESGAGDGEADDADPVAVGLWQRGGGAVERADVQARLRTRPVRVVGSCGLAEDLRAALAGAGLQIAADGAPAATAVVVGAHEEDPVLTEWNAARLEEAAPDPWLAVVSFSGGQAVVGPWVVPGESACYECFLLRRASVFGVHEVSSALAGAEPVGPVFDGSARHPGMRLIQTGAVVDRITERVGLQDRSGQAVPGGVTTISLRHDEIGMEHHRVLRVPRCPRCSPSAGIGYPQVWYAKGAAE